MRRPKPIDHTADRPLYKQVADDLRDQITGGDLHPGEKLPGEARLCDIYNVGMNTIRGALNLLRTEGLVVTEKGRGSRVRERQERSVVNIPPGARITIRPATEDERREFGLGEREPVVVVEDGGHSRVWPAYRHVFEAGHVDATPPH